MSTHATFFENDFMNNFKLHSKMLLKEIIGHSSPMKLTRVIGVKEEETSPSLSGWTRVVNTREEKEKTTELSQRVI